MYRVIVLTETSTAKKGQSVFNTYRVNNRHCKSLLKQPQHRGRQLSKHITTCILASVRGRVMDRTLARFIAPLRLKHSRVETFILHRVYANQRILVSLAIVSKQLIFMCHSSVLFLFLDMSPSDFIFLKLHNFHYSSFNE